MKTSATFPCKSSVLLFVCLLAGSPGVWAQAVPNGVPTLPEQVARAAERAHFGSGHLRARNDFALNDQEAAQLQSIFTTAQNAYARILPGPDEGSQRKAVSLELSRELETFLQQHPDSAWAADVSLELARACQLRSSYSKAISYYSKAWQATKDADQNPSFQIALDTVGPLGKLLALTGRLAEWDALEAEARAVGKEPPSSDWMWAKRFAALARQHPTEAYKCGLYCLDQVGRLTQRDSYNPPEVLETESSPEGFSAAELVAIGRKAKLSVSAVMLNDFSELPVPCVVHLAVGHFVVVRERRGDFYEVVDPVAFGSRWLTAAELAEDATGCLLVSLNSMASPAVAQRLQPMDDATAAGYRGRCHSFSPYGHVDPGPCPPPDGGCCPPPGPPGSPPSSPPSSPRPPGQRPGGNSPPDQNCSTCERADSGMPTWFISEAYANLWITDTPLDYTPAYGPRIPFKLAFNGSRDGTSISGNANQGALAGAHWSCSWLSYAEVDSSGYSSEVSLPGSGWAMFSFGVGATNSDINYKRNTQLQKVLQSGSLVGLHLVETDGSYLEYGNVSDQGTYKLLFLTGWYDAQGNKVTFAYSSGLLSSVTFADGTVFQVYYNDSNDSTLITSVSTSGGPSATLVHGETGPGNPDNYAIPQNITTITDAASISSHVYYPYPGNLAGSIVTPYGTTTFTHGIVDGVFDVSMGVTRADGSQELYGMMNSYGGADWPDFTSGQIPASTPIGTLDTTGRFERNTVYWDSRQFSGLESKDHSLFDWGDFKKARIRHWLASSVDLYTHYDTLSLEQAPSPDGSAEGQLTWYDYAGKPSGVNYERGTQIMPSVIARVMPDGTTWYRYRQYTSIGKPTSEIEKWVSGGTAYYRTNTFTYSSDGFDLKSWTGPANELISGRSLNSYHQVLTETNAVVDVTTYTYESSAPRRLLTALTPAGLLSTSSYDGSGRLQKVVDSISGSPLRTNSYTWLNGDLRTQTDPRGLIVTNTYDGLHRLTRVDYPDTSSIQYVYTNGSGVMLLDLTGVKDRLGNWAYYEYDALRRKIQVNDPRGVLTGYGYCSCGALEYVTNAVGTSLQTVTHYVYDNQARRTQIYFPDSTSMTNTFDALGRLTISGDAAASTTNYYDNLNRLVAVTNAFGQFSKTLYDIEDHATNTVDANGVSVTNTFDSLGRLLTRTYPDSGVEKFGYTALGLFKYTNQLNLVTSYGYDAALRKTKETNANNEIITYTYSPASDLKTLTDGNSHVTTWNYDLYGRVTNKLDQASVEILRYQYDANSRLTNRWSKAFNNTTYLYDSVGNLTNVDYPSGTTDIGYSYDALNRLTNMVDAAGTSKFTYNANGQLLTEDGPWSNDTLTYSYDSGRLRKGLSLQQPTSTWTNGFTYDAARRLSTVIFSGGTFTSTYQTPGSLVKKIALPNTSYITNTYDGNARLTGTYLDNSSDTILDKSEYLYNSGNQRIRITRTDASYYTNTYDNIGQLKWADSTVASEDRGYLYDAAWNLTKRTNNATPQTFAVDSKNQLTSEPGYTDQYDINGNLTQRYDGGYNVAYTYTYNAENQLTSVAYKSSYTATNYWWKVELTTDGLGRLRKRIDYTWLDPYGWYNAVETRYVYDGRRVIQERNSSGTPLVAYTRGSDLSGSLEGAGGIGGLLARSHGYSSGTGAWSTHNFYHADGGGNVTYMVNTSQSVVASYRYDPFGRTISSSGSLASANVYRFSSKEIHVNSAMYYYGYRWYDPNLQRWPNRDPIGEAGFELIRKGVSSPIAGDPNRYLFVQNNPNGFVDSDGRGAIAIPIAVGGGTTANPITGALCVGVAAGTALCWAFPDTMTKPGQWAGDLLCPRQKPFKETCFLANDKIEGYCIYNCPSGPRVIPKPEMGCPIRMTFHYPNPLKFP